MTWAMIRKLFLQAVGDNQSARDEAWLHLTQALRLITTDPAIDVPELAVIDDTFVVVASTDYTEMSSLDFDSLAIMDVFNKTRGYPIDPEPGGMTGRRRYLDTTGKPPSGEVTHYVRDGTRLYVRSTPSANTTLIVRARRQVAALSSADENSSPPTPEQYDWPIIYRAAENYYSVHPMAGEGAPDMAGRFRVQAQGQINGLQNVRTVEDKAHRGTMRLRGYRVGPRTRFG